MKDVVPDQVAHGLLAPDEALPFEIVNPDAEGRVLLVCDHASHAVPRALDGLGLDEIELLRHIGWDIGAANVTRHLAAALDAPAVLGGYSRLVIDCNRELDHPGLLLAESDGTPVPANANLTAAERDARIAEIHTPFHAAIEREIARLRAANGPDTNPVILSIHSFTPIMDDIERPWQIGILWNRDARIPEPLIARLRRESDLNVGDNEPYSARFGYGYTLERHGDGLGLANALVEIRQELIDTPRGVTQWSDRLLAALHDVLARDDIYRPAGVPAHDG
ncbi:MAG: N-formylglutamate amidohydrolase [Alphaproteobacteria bacterium]